MAKIVIRNPWIFLLIFSAWILFIVVLFAYAAHLSVKATLLATLGTWASCTISYKGKGLV